MSTSSTRRAILVAVDGSAPATAAVEWAAREAVLRNVPLTLAHVVTPSAMMMWPEVSVPPDYAEWQRILEAARVVAHGGGREDLRLYTEMPIGSPVTMLVDLSDDAQMIVVGSHGRGALGRMVLGSVSSSLIRQAHCPVAVIRDENLLVDNPAQAPVVVGIDGSAASDAATELAFDEASRRGVDLIAVHAVSDTDLIESSRVDWSVLERRGNKVLDERLAEWQERYPDVRVRREVPWSHPAKALVKEAEGAQLVVVGSRGRGGFTGMVLGSVAWAVVQSAPTPVIVARG